jgi:hypothetical protein
MKNGLIRMEDTNASVDPPKDGFTDLEKILQGKTFTRYILSYRSYNLVE